MKLKLLVSTVAGLLILAGVGTLTQAAAQIAGNCGGNQTVRPAPFSCDSSRTFTVSGLQRTVSVHLQFNADGSATASYTLDKVVPQPFPIRVRSHAGLSSTPGNLVDDVSGQFPAGTLGPVVLSFKFDCGQIDVKAVFTGVGDERGRVAGPYICKPVVVPTTVPAPTTTVPATTVPGSVDQTSLPTSTVAASVAPSGTLPPTGANEGGSPFPGAALIGLGLGAFLLLIRHLRRQPRTA